MGNRAVPAFLLVALLVPLPKALSATEPRAFSTTEPKAFSAAGPAAPGPFVDVPPVGTVRGAAQIRSLSLLHGLEAFVQPQPTDAAAQAVAPATPLASGRRAVAAVPAARGWEAAPRTLRAPDSAPSGAALRHRVAAGDTLFDLARRYGTTVDAIAAANTLSSPHALQIGQELIIPPKAKVPAAVASAPRRQVSSSEASVAYRVQPGDTLFAIARRYGTTVEAIAAANGLPSAHRLRVGQRLVLPAGRRLAPAALAVRAARPPLAARPALSWPARGMITSRYGWRYRQHHDGIDLAAPWGTPIHAARAGRVVLAGWYYGYGRTVIIEHEGGLRTLYGHASRLLVRPGQVVRQGERIALVGCTGRCTGAHVHFEVRINGRPVNPLPYLR